jgi:hypothetical protein
MKPIFIFAAGIALTAIVFPASAEELPKELICAPIEIGKCTSEEGCAKVSRSAANAPTFIKVDLDDKKVAFRRFDGSYGFQVIDGQVRMEKQLLLHGIVKSSESSPDGYAWSMSITNQGRMSLSVSAPEIVYAVNGNCEAL